ncbi:hypothetical protein MMP66_05965 [Acinetobacter dispersus]|uniref:Uncharacterized protein n=1 Tax=Acinetobacter dispersus TaxID=70348 RepID=N9L612_9GAMM|nr:hypothetical protein [Acinetobacter dispersus]ENW91763.1 hypothetical protein F904_01700 [Acinetobacter dispersus]MCH7382810.1 hypothetical protein [Acinetobacter dispersus]MCH7391400.1 hypothetical protein [Acinetobacter dispersus]MCH7393825.1 hypothetical protein [Acinetobacter dispersus]
MKESMNSEVSVNAEAFTIATQMYVRLRRVCGRVIDVMYLVNNQDYAKHVLEVALATEDQELARFVARLSPLIDLYAEPSVAALEVKAEAKKVKAEVLETYSVEVTEEEIYQAQVHHHYIGALR